MKKSRSLLVVLLLIVGIFTITGCGNKEDELKKNGNKLNLQVENIYDNDGTIISLDFYYPKDAGIELYENDYTSERSKIITDKEDNYKISFSLSEDSTYSNNKKSNKERYEDKFKEIKIGKYDAYSIETYKSIEIYVLLEQLQDTQTRWATITIDVLSQSGNNDSGIDFFNNNEEVKSIVNSLTYNGVVSK